MLSSKQRKYLRSKAHHLKPVVFIGKAEVNNSVFKTINECLCAHELIKVKIAMGDRSLRDETICEICRKSDALLVQRIGNIATFFRKNPDADPRKSNLQRQI